MHRCQVVVGGAQRPHWESADASMKRAVNSFCKSVAVSEGWNTTKGPRLNCSNNNKLIAVISS